MPINRLFKAGKITAEKVEKLNKAYSFALRSLSLVDRDDPICEIIAHKVIEIEASGTDDPREIGRLAASHFKY